MKKIASSLILVILLFSFSIVALADQAAYITKAQARRAVTLLGKQNEILHYCQPCADKTRRNETIEKIEMSKTEDGKYWEVKVNGKSVDLAYIFYRTKSGKWKNVARELKIKVKDVSTYLPAIAK